MISESSADATAVMSTRSVVQLHWFVLNVAETSAQAIGRGKEGGEGVLLSEQALHTVCNYTHAMRRSAWHSVQCFTKAPVSNAQ